MPPGLHALLFAIERNRIAADIVIVLPHTRRARIGRAAGVIIDFGPITRKVHRTLRFLKRRRAVGLILTVISRRYLATTNGNMSAVVRIGFDGLGSSSRIPHGRVATAQTNHLVSRHVRNVIRRAIAIELIEFGVTVGLHAFDVLSLTHEEGRKSLRGHRPRSMLFGLLERSE